MNKFFGSVCVAAWLFAAGAACDAAAQTATPLADAAGRWAGTTPFKDRPVPTQLEIAGSSPGTASAQLHYGEPVACRVTARYAGLNSTGTVFAIRNSTGGYCDRLITGFLEVRTTGDGHLLVSVRAGMLPFQVTQLQRAP
jgi:hypothetical protein